ncbi:MAG: SNF2-related protein, partial [Ilumatobacteraceae bacterium]
MRRRDQLSLTLQLSWHDNALHLWGVDATNGSVAPVFDVLRLVDHQLGRHISAAAVPGRIPVNPLAPFGQSIVPTLRVHLRVLADLPRGQVSESVAWFGAAADVVAATLRAGRVRPVLSIDGAVHVAHWVPVADHAIEDALTTLHGQMPPICGVTDMGRFFDAAVDAVARCSLSEQAWRPPQPRHGRGTEYRAAQATFRALASASGSVLYRSDDLAALGDLSRVLSHEADRAAGIPVLGAQLRLHLPDAIDDPWRLGLELVDLDQPDHWCRAADVLASTPLALDLARKADHLPRLHERLVDAGQLLGEHLGPLLAAFKGFLDDPAAEAELDVDEVETFLATAPDTLESIGIRLLGPEQLIRAKAGMHASATPRAASPTRGSFTAGALVEWSATVDDAPIDDAQLERAAAAGSSLIHVNGRWVRLDAKQVRATLDRLHRHRDEHAELDVASLMKLAAESVATAERGNAALALQGNGWIAELLAGLPDERLVEVREPDNFAGELRHYQRRGLSWMGFLGRLGLGGCLADDMGLGKTATTLAHLSTRAGPHLVVCPLSVVHNWYAESARFTPHLQVAIHHGTERARGDDAIGQLLPADIVVTTYGLLARDIDTLASVRWSTLVLDEAQAVKNHLTRAAKAVRRIDADQKVALTGTPVENHLGELWAILDAVNPGLYGSSTQFTDRYARPIQRNGDPAATAALRSLTQPFILRHTKADKSLLPELPDKIEQIAWATLTREQAAMYQAVVDRLLADANAATGMKRRGLVLAALTRLKQICNHPA